MWRYNLAGPESTLDIEMANNAHQLFHRGELAEDPLGHDIIYLTWTKPDLKWDYSMVAYYQDGIAVHKGAQTERDMEIDRVLVHRHWFVIRIRYKGKMPKWQRRAIWKLWQLAVAWRSRVRNEQGKEALAGGHIVFYDDDVDLKNVFDDELHEAAEAYAERWAR